MLSPKIALFPQSLEHNAGVKKNAMTAIFAKHTISISLDNSRISTHTLTDDVYHTSFLVAKSTSTEELCRSLHREH